MTIDFIKKIISEDKFLNHYVNESFDKPYENFIRIDDFNYLVDTGEFKILYFFRMGFDDKKLWLYTKKDSNVNFYYDFNWKWQDIDNDKINKDIWVRSTATAYKIINDFIKNINPDAINFSPQTDGNKKVYFNEFFIDRLQTLFNGYDVFSDKIKEYVLMVKKEKSNAGEERIKKIVENTEMNYNDAFNYVKFPHKRKNKMKGIIRNDFRKEQLKRIVYSIKYF